MEKEKWTVCNQQGADKQEVWYPWSMMNGVSANYYELQQGCISKLDVWLYSVAHLLNVKDRFLSVYGLISYNLEYFVGSRSKVEPIISTIVDLQP